MSPHADTTDNAGTEAQQAQKVPSDGTAAATVVKNEEKYIPTIDLSDYFSPSSPSSRQKLTEQVRTACLEHGFFQVVGHGVPLDVQRRMLDACKAFFDLPRPAKVQLSLKKYSWRRGYEGPGEQQSNDPQQLNLLPDQKEGFFVGKELPLDQVAFARGPNIWPPQLPESEFRRPVMEYFDHLMRLGHKVMEVLAVSLGHPPTILEKLTRDPAM